MGGAYVANQPATSSSLNSAPIRTNFGALFAGDLQPLRVTAQASPNMTVAVASDNNRAYIAGNTPLDYAGGNSSSFTAPTGGQKRIDILTLSSAGALEITQGTPTAGTPSPPSYPIDKMVLAEIYLRSGMSSIKNTDDSANGYIFKDRTPLFNFGFNPTVSSGGLIYLDSKVASASASLDFTNYINSSYNLYVFELNRILAATDNIQFYFRVSTDGGSTFKSGASDYRTCDYGYEVGHPTTPAIGAGINATTAIYLSSSSAQARVSNLTNEFFSGTLKLYYPSNGNVVAVTGQFSYFAATARMVGLTVSGMYYGSTSAVNAVRFVMSSGNIASGTIRMYGVINS